MSTQTRIPSYAELKNSSYTLVRADMRSNANTAEGAGVDRQLPADSANHQFDPIKGFDPGGSDAFKYDLTSLTNPPAGFAIADCKTEMLWRWEATPGFNSDDLTPNAAIAFASAENPINGYIECQENGLYEVVWARLGNSQGGGFYVSNKPDRGDSIEWVSYWTPDGDMYTFVDRLLLDKQTGVTWPAGNFDNIYLGGLTTVNTDHQGEYLRNFYIGSKSLQLPFNEVRILNFGTSMSAQGGPGPKQSSPLDDSVKLPWVPTNTTNGCGYASGGIDPQPTGYDSDAGMYATMIRELGKKNIFPFDDNRNHAQSGGTAASAITQFGNISNYSPTDAVFELGANDAVQQIADATFQANIETMITNMYEMGVKRLYIYLILTLSADSTYRTTAYYDEVDNKNQILIDAVKWANVTKGYGPGFAHLVDTRSVFGTRENFNSDLFQSDNIHVNELGSHYLGLLGGRVMAKAISNTQASGSSSLSIIG